MEEERQLKKYYQHFKGNYYMVICTAHDSELPDEENVIYQAGYGDNKIWSRNKNNFLELIKRDGKMLYRFNEVTEAEYLANANTDSLGNRIYRVFVSIPFTGMEDTIYIRYQEAVEFIMQNVEVPDKAKLEIVKQENFDQIVSQCKSVPDNLYPYYMGKDVEAVLKCDAVFFGRGWQNSKGCQIEHTTAEQFKKKIYYQENEQSTD